MYLVGDASLNTLYHLRFRSVFAAERGRHGEGSNRTGRSGEHLKIPVPLGTQVSDAESDEFLGEVLSDGDTLRLARGGRGGRGNARFATPTHRAPREAEPGSVGEERRWRLELKLLADVGIVGLPNVGKSTLIAAISAARPKIADYPFTTLTPHLGVVAEGPLSEPFVVADLPGLIEGAATGAGLGHQFLRHVERCRILLHLVDLSASAKDAEVDVETLEAELGAFDPGLLERRRILVGTKLDLVSDDRRRDALKEAARRRGIPYLEISSITREGITELVAAVRKTLDQEAEG